ASRRLHLVRLRTHADDLAAVIAQRRPEAARYIAVGVAEAEMQARARIAGADVLQRRGIRFVEQLDFLSELRGEQVAERTQIVRRAVERDRAELRELAGIGERPRVDLA